MVPRQPASFAKKTDSRRLADLLLDIGVRDRIDIALPLLLHPARDWLLTLAYDLTRLRGNSETILDAVERASKVVFALKNYARVEHNVDKQLIDVRASIETVLNLYGNQLPTQLAHWQAGAALLDHMRSQVCDVATMSFDPDGVCSGPHPLAAANAPAAHAAPHAPNMPRVLELKDGRAFDCLCRAYLMHGQRMGTVVSFRDVIDRERSAKVTRHQALHDCLSGLPNRLQFGQALDHAVAQARSTGDGLAVLFVDLDHFKRVNDTLGHDFGNLLLKCTAQRLSTCLRDCDLIARWGGDGFTVLAPKIRSVDEVQSLAQRILQALEEPFVPEEMSLQISASVGPASYPDDGEDGQALLRRADMALYRAKQEGRNGTQCFRHSAFADLNSNGGLSLDADLRRAI